MPKIELYNRDCMEAMAEMPDKCFQLAICDPQYGIGEDGQSNHSRGCLATATKFTPKQWDNEPPSIKYFTELKRVSKHQIIWGANHFISRIPYNSSCWIVWDKLNGETDFADCELAYTSFQTAVRKFSFRWQGMLQGDMKNKEARIHPTQKPVKLYEWLLKNYAKPGDKILDTHGGSFSSAIACYNLDFDYTGFELDKEYFDAGKARLEEHMKQARLFDGIDTQGNVPERDKVSHI